MRKMAQDEAQAALDAVRYGTYEEARRHKPRGACYCDLDDRACFEAGHWANFKPARLKAREGAEAADEIERLRAALQDITGIHNLTISDAGKWMRAYGMARRALEGK